MVEKKRNLYNILIVAFVAFGSFAFGYSNTIIGTTLAQPSFRYVDIVTRYILSEVLTQRLKIVFCTRCTSKFE